MIRLVARCQLAILLAVGYVVDSRAISLDDLHYSFANYLGSGIYRAGDEDVQVYQIPFSYRVKTPASNGCELKLKVPLTFGFYNFNLGDIPANGLPEDVSTMSVAVGVESYCPISKRWRLGPAFDIGWAKNFENYDATTFNAYGLKSLYQVENGGGLFTLGNNLLFARQNGSINEVASEFASFETGVDYRFRSFNLVGAHLADFSVYYVNFRYFNNLEFLRLKARPVEVLVQNEVGFTFGVKLQERYQYLDIPRIGLGYRTGNKLTAVRLVFGMPF
jgi:hypothetical protein